MWRQARHGEARCREGVKLSAINVQAVLRRIVVNESPRIVYTGIMNDKGVRYTVVRHRNERHGQKRACKFDRDIFVAMVEQSRGSVARLNIMNDLSWTHCRAVVLALLAAEQIAFDFVPIESHFIPSFSIHSCISYIYMCLFIILCQRARRNVGTIWGTPPCDDAAHKPGVLSFLSASYILRPGCL